MQLFIIYAREDSEEKDRIYKLIQKPLSAMGVSVWHDSFIRIGENWEEKLLNQLNESAIFLFLLSEDFFHSDFIRTVEFSEACKKNRKKEALILPLLINNCNWIAHEEIKKIQVFPRDGVPLLHHTNKAPVLKKFLDETELAVNLFIEQENNKRIRLERQVLLDERPINKIVNYVRTELPKLEENLNKLDKQYPRAGKLIQFAVVALIIIIILVKCA